jgi:hypothetical protein
MSVIYTQNGRLQNAVWQRSVVLISRVKLMDEFVGIIVKIVCICRYRHGCGFIAAAPQQAGSKANSATEVIAEVSVINVQA